MVRLTERFIFFPLRRVVLFCVVDRVDIRSVNCARSSAAAFAICAFFSSLEVEKKFFFSPPDKVTLLT